MMRFKIEGQEISSQACLPSPRKALEGIAETKCIHAMEQIRRMQGGSQAHLMRCSDGHYYVVKFPNNPQGRKVLFNELFASRLAVMLKLPVPEQAIVDVSQELISLTPNLSMDVSMHLVPCEPGLCFGSQMPYDPRKASYLTQPYSLFNPAEIENGTDVLGMLVFDKWTCNTDGRQVICARPSEDARWFMLMIDQGGCFNQEDWTFPDSPIRGRFRGLEVYKKVRGLESFEPWLSRLDEIADSAIAAAAYDIPSKWHGEERWKIDKLVSDLNRRKGRVRELLWSMRDHTSEFPNWPSRPFWIGVGRETAAQRGRETT
jgi:hypothetical protein